MLKHFALLVLLSGFVIGLSAQNNVNLKTCEEAFIKNNLLILAEQYNIDIAKANIIQAKIWDLPSASFEFNVINPQNSRVFDVGGRGQKALAIQQLFYLGKKKQNEVAFAKSNAELAALQYEQLIRNLRYQLHQSFYSIYFEKQKLERFNVQIHNIDTLFNAYSQQVTKGNIPLRDVVRLQSLLFSLKNDVIAIQKNINDEETNIKVLTGFTETINPIVEEAEINTVLDKKNIPQPEDLLKIALTKNPDYLTQQKLIQNNELFLRWQKSLAIPDVTAGLNYDQRGGAFQNQINFTVGMPIPLWNRNKGNIQAAEIQQRQSLTLNSQKLVEIRNSIENTYATWSQQHENFELTKASSTFNFDIVYDGVLRNFQKRNLSLLEFTDFMESYSQSILQLNEIKKQLMLSCETLNYIVSDKVF